MRDAPRHLLAVCLLTAVVVGCYWNSLANGFTYDDEILIVKNRIIKDLRSLPHLVSPSYFYESTELSYRPLVTFTYFVDYRLWGLKPFGFHLTSLLLHLAATLGVYALFHRLLAPAGRGALIGASLFAAHPILTEAVDNIGYREDPLATGLMLLALYCLLRQERSPQPRWLVAAGLVVYGLALLAKETAVTLPVLLLVADWTRAPTPDTPAWWRPRLPLYAGVALVTMGYLVLRFGVMHFPGEDIWPYPQPSLGTRLLTWPYTTWLHLRLLFIPLDLSANYIFHAPPTVTDPMVIFPAAVLGVLLLGLLWLWVRGERLACLSLLWIAVALGPVANLIPIRHPVAERYLYLPAVGFALLLTLALMRLRTRALTLGLAGLLVLTYGALTIQRNPVWHDDFSLWQDTVAKVPQSPWVHSNLGVEYELRGDFTRALREYAWAAYLFPGFATPHQGAGRIYLYQGRLELAAQQFREAIRRNPKNDLVLANLGVVYQRQGRFERAIRLYRAVLTTDPQNAEVWANLGAALAASGRRAAAREAFEQALALNPQEAVIHHNLGTLLAETGQVKAAIQRFQTALRLNPRLGGAHASLAALYARLGRHDEARAEAAAAKRAGASEGGPVRGGQ